MSTEVNPIPDPEAVLPRAPGSEARPYDFDLSVRTLEKILGTTLVEGEVDLEKAAHSQCYDEHGAARQTGMTHELLFKAFRSSYWVMRTVTEIDGQPAATYLVASAGDWGGYVWEFNLLERSALLHHNPGSSPGTELNEYGHAIIQSTVWQIFIRSQKEAAAEEARKALPSIAKAKRKRDRGSRVRTMQLPANEAVL